MANQDTERQWVYLDELARLMDCTVRALRRRISTGQLVAYKPIGARRWRVWLDSPAFETNETKIPAPEQPAEVEA